MRQGQTEKSMALQRRKKIFGIFVTYFVSDRLISAGT